MPARQPFRLLAGALWLHRYLGRALGRYWSRPGGLALRASLFAYRVRVDVPLPYLLRESSTE